MKGKVLVIEDNQAWQDLLKKYLERDGFYVEIVDNLESALTKVKHELFHFITIDMRLDDSNQAPGRYEGWTILKVVKELRIQNLTPCMIVTAHGEDYHELKKSKNVESLFIMEKANFDRKQFLAIINRMVEQNDLRFKDDHRGV
jgi:DNA-binding response OmpR family regulator